MPTANSNTHSLPSQIQAIPADSAVSYPISYKEKAQLVFLSIQTFYQTHGTSGIFFWSVFMWGVGSEFGKAGVGNTSLSG